MAVLVMGALTIADAQRRPWDAEPSAPATISPGADGYGQPNTALSGEFTGEHLITQLNEALAGRDREAFFAHVDGAAVPPLQLWWDNMEVLGWTAAAFSVQSPQRSHYNESLFEGNGTCAPRLRVTGRTLRGCVQSMEGAFPSERDFVDAGDATCAYALSGSLYAYAARLGVDVYALADQALATGEPLWTLVERGGVAFTAEAWSEWLRRRYG